MGYNFCIMWKYLSGFVLLLAVSLLVSGKYENYTHDAAANSQSRGGSPVASADAEVAANYAEQAERDHPRWFLAYQIFGWPSGITVWALFLTLMVIADQTRHTARAAKATEDAARASQKQIDHLLTSERAWLTITAVNKRDCVIRRGALPPFRWRVKNVGKTPAKIIETQAACQLTDSYKFPLDPAFPTDTIKVQDRILAPGDIMEYFTYWSDENGQILRCQMEDIEVVWLTAFGYVKYKTVLDEEIHETRFCDDFINGLTPEERNGRAIRIRFMPNLLVPSSYTKST